MSWLITGGCGFVGSNLAHDLLSSGETVVVLDNLSRQGSPENLTWLRSQHGRDWQFVQADIRDRDRVADLVRELRPQAIAHLAGQVAMTTSIQDPRLDFEVNALGTLNVLEAVRLYSSETIVLYSSTNKVYGSLEELTYGETETRYTLPDYPHGLAETLQLDGCSPYGCSKLAADQYVRDYHRVYGIPTVVFRHSSMYGGRQFATYDQGWIGWFCLQALAMSDSQIPPFTISGNGKQVRDVLHAQDLIRAYRLAVTQIDRCAGEIYNLGGGMANSLSLLELFAILTELTGYPLRFRSLDWRHGDQKVFVADLAKVNQHLGWSPTVSKQDGLRMMLDWTEEVQARVPTLS
ncbi:CDP-paratose 2-epimerase [Leptolyngbya sp. 'hensonii']|uniref:GDP-mannose 4,6-dehydratase n=1 Tax=Leptolyngbya sp. 'hensonii' TaxID=1922337 RepID=UPI00094F96E4|nr:GDP-mannose 4,6-dehydratase [Leptolyngbya sp. 'hensonii']OLP18623.1 CDP-paratose 2-epimerase [Leptolyngbya sp. 'hensonii']